MRRIKILMVLLGVLWLAACSSLQPAPTATPTFTATSSPTPTYTTTPTLTPTVIPTRTATPQRSNTPAAPNTPTPSFSPTPRPLATRFSPTPYTRSPVTDCFVTTLESGISLAPAPLHPPQVLPTMEPGVIYQAVDFYYPLYQLARDGVPVGWVVFMHLGLSVEGAGCSALHESSGERPLTQFPGLCFFTSDSDIEPLGPFAPNWPLVVLWKTRESFFTCLGPDAGPCFYVQASKVSTFGACESVPSAGTMTASGWLWSLPDGQQGEKVVSLTIGQQVFIQGNPVDGNRPPDANEEGAWYQVIVANPGESISGWVWSALLSFD